MKKNILFLLLLFFTVSSLYSENIILKNGTVFKNIKIINKDKSGFVHFQLSNNKKKRKIHFNAILKIDKIPFDENKDTEIISSSFEDQVKFNKNQAEKNKNESNLKSLKQNGKKYIFPNKKFFPVTILALSLSIDSFITASDLNDIIKKNKDLPNVDNSSLEEQRNRRYIFGTIYCLVGIINTFFMLEKVELNANSNTFGLSYKF